MRHVFFAAIAFALALSVYSIPVNAQLTAVGTPPVTSVLTVGSNGEQVSSLQNLLGKFGFFTASTTGYFGQVTKNAVATLQSSFGLESVGYTGPQTRNLLNQLASVNLAVGTSDTTMVPSEDDPPVQGGGLPKPIILPPIGTIPTSTSPTVTLPTLTFTADKYTIKAGESVNVSWTSTGVANCTAGGTAWGGPQPTAATKKVTIFATGQQSLVLTCKAVNGYSVARVILVQVLSPSVSNNPTPVDPTVPSSGAPTLNLTITPGYATPGTQTTVTWSSTGATKCTGKPNNSLITFGPSLPLSGSLSYQLTQATHFRVTCTGPGGSVEKAVWRGYNGTATPPVNPPKPPVPPATTTPPVPPAPPTPPTPPGTPGTLSGNYPVAPSKTYLREIYIDPKNGQDTGDGSAAKPFKSFENASTQKKLKQGDHIILLAGNHGAIKVNKYTSPTLVGGKSWSWIEFRAGATAQSMTIQHTSNWIITKAEVVSRNKPPLWALVVATDSENIIFADSLVASATSNSGWSKSDWMDANSGIFYRNVICGSIIRNQVTNIRHGISATTDTNSPTPSKNSVKVLIQDNRVQHVSADGIRPIGSDIKVAKNYIADFYVSGNDGDGNHDDGIQNWALNGSVYGNIELDSNWIQESTNANRPWQSDIQGIGNFDGLIKDFRITNNVVLVSAWHGIAVYGADGAVVKNNTVANPSANGRNTWILSSKSKGNTLPKNVTISNNIAVVVNGHGDTKMTDNILVKAPKDVFQAFNPGNNQINLTAKNGSPIFGKNVGSSLKTSPVQ
jgi:peptidoglycan hydrolase-like protein with peptidoglycan-binding domain